ncbi:MAG: Spy/CpxP family protein refolding chaperone [Coleofasciculus sp. C2-GNP5-27]
MIQNSSESFSKEINIMFLRCVYVLIVVASSLSSTNALAESTFVNSQAATENSEPPNSQEIPEIIQKINLTSRQVEALQIINETREPILPLYEELDQARQKLDDLLLNPEVSETQLREKFNEIEELRAQISRMRFESRMAIRNVLEPEQIILFERYVQGLDE